MLNLNNEAKLVFIFDEWIEPIETFSFPIESTLDYQVYFIEIAVHLTHLCSTNLQIYCMTKNYNFGVSCST